MFRNDIWRSVVDDLRTRGLIEQPVESLGALLDLAAARGEFVRAIGRSTVAWQHLVSQARDGTAADAVLPWLRANRLDTPWMRDWAARAVAMVLQYDEVDAQRRRRPVHIDSIIMETAGAPTPDLGELLARVDGVLDTLLGWQGDEPPPNPVSESRTTFLARMEVAWNFRAELLELSPPTRRRLDKHAEWFARHHVGRELPTDIRDSERDSPELQTIKAALKSFPILIEMPVDGR